MADLQPNEIRSILRPRNRRRLAITSAELYRSNMLLLNRRPSVAKPHHLSSPPMQLQRLVLSSVCLSSPRTQPQTVTSRPPARDPRALLAQQLPLHRSDQEVSLRGRSPTTLLSVLRPQQQHDHRQAVQGCLREATLTHNPQRLQWLPPTPKVASRSPRARTTPSLRHTLNRSLRAWASRALDSQAHSKCNRLKLDLLADTPRVATNVLTLSPRHLAALHPYSVVARTLTHRILRVLLRPRIPTAGRTRRGSIRGTHLPQCLRLCRTTIR